MKLLFFLALFSSVLSEGLFCSTNEDCNGNKGNCVNSTCFCITGWTVSPGSSIDCNYQQINQSYYFYLEFVFLYGLGHIYAGNYVLGIVKLVLFVFLITQLTLIPICSKFVDDKCDNGCIRLLVGLFFLFFSMGFFGWVLFDLIAIGNGFYYDGNGVPLVDWNMF